MNPVQQKQQQQQQQPQCGLCEKLFEKHLDLRKHVCEVAIKMHQEKSGVKIDERPSLTNFVTNDDNIMVVDKENVKNSNTNKDKTDLELKPEALVNDKVSEKFPYICTNVIFWEEVLYVCLKD